LIVSRCDGAVDLEVTEYALDAVALAVEALAVADRFDAVDFGGMTGLIRRAFKSARIASVS
jgi:hypothetical protein